MGMIEELEDIMRACCLKRHPMTRRMYRYTLICEYRYAPKDKIYKKYYSIIKSHTELEYNEKLGKRKKIRVKDDAVRGNLPALMLYMINELKGFESR